MTWCNWKLYNANVILLTVLIRFFALSKSNFHLPCDCLKRCSGCEAMKKWKRSWRRCTWRTGRRKPKAACPSSTFCLSVRCAGSSSPLSPWTWVSNCLESMQWVYVCLCVCDMWVRVGGCTNTLTDLSEVHILFSSFWNLESSQNLSDVWKDSKSYDDAVTCFEALW